jgi:hypothetical protein
LSASVPPLSLPRSTTRRFANSRTPANGHRLGSITTSGFGSDGNLKVSEIWNSREQFEVFGKRLMPILAGAGIQFTNPPDIFEVHNIVKD